MIFDFAVHCSLGKTLPGRVFVGVSTNPGAFQEGRPQQETRRRSQERAGEHLDERLLQEKEEALTLLLQEAKIISQESDHLQVI